MMLPLLLLALACTTDADRDGFDAAEDCDDSDPSVFPGGVEICNEVDDDCDGLVDEHAADAPRWFEDADGDSYGDPATAVEACQAPAGAVPRGGDCDDADPDRNPRREEVCASGVDEDCDGMDDFCSGRWGVEEIGFAYEGTSPGDLLGWSVALGDLDGDGLAEIVAGAPQEEVGGTGYVWVSGAEESVIIEGFRAGDQAGRHLAAGGDFDGDGVGDLLVGAAEVGLTFRQAGAAYLISGADLASGNLEEASRAVLLGPEAEDFAGRAVDLQGDWDGDGLADAVIAGAHEHLGGREHPGRVWLVAGQPELEDHASLADVATLTLEGPADGDFLGRSVSHGGDLDGDGLDDLVMGAYGDDTSGDRAGAVWVVLAEAEVTGSQVVDQVASACWLGISDMDHAGRWVSGGADTNGDGYGDALVGAFGGDRETGGAWLVRGGPSLADGTLDEVATVHFAAEGAYDRTGLGLDLGGDLDGDGLADMVIGAPNRSERADADGAAYVILGRPGLGGTLDLSHADLVVGGQSAGDGLGQAVVIGPDTDGDGLDDLLLGAAYADEERGAAWLVLGGRSGH